MNDMIKQRVLLLDDRIVSRPSSGIESKLESFAVRLSSKEGFATKAPPAVDERGFSLEDMKIDEFAHICRGWIDEFEAGGIVLDLNWWGDDEYGPKLWTIMKENGLAVSKDCVVFLTMFVAPEKRAEIADELGLSPLQVNYKDTTGYSTAAKWLVDHL